MAMTRTLETMKPSGSGAPQDDRDGDGGVDIDPGAPVERPETVRLCEIEAQPQVPDADQHEGARHQPRERSRVDHARRLAEQDRGFSTW